MIVTVKTDKFKKCLCGYKPKEYYIGYGRTPYILSCKCGKSLHDAKCTITNHANHLIDYWNKSLRHKTKEELEIEYDAFRKEVEKVRIENGQTPKEYRYFWFKGTGEKLIQNWY